MQIFIPYWHKNALQELVSEKRSMMVMEQQTVFSDLETDLDTTYDVLVEPLHNESNAETTRVTPSLQEDVMATDGDSRRKLKSDPQRKVAEWMQHDNDDTTEV